MSLKLIINPAAGRGRAVKAAARAMEALDARGVDYDTVWTQKPRHGTDVAAKAAEEFETIVAIGGDGTINEIGEGLTGTDASFGVLRVGSGNDFAKLIGIPNKLEKAVDILLAGKTKKTDVATVNDRITLNGMGIGFDAVVADTANKVKRLRGLSIYIYALLKSLMKYNSIDMRIEFDDVVIEEKVFLAAFCIGKSLGGGFILAPDSIIDDGYIDACIIRDLPKNLLIRKIGKAFDGTIIEMPQVETFRANHVTVESEQPMPIHVEGEIMQGSIKRVEIDVIPKSLNVIGDW